MAKPLTREQRAWLKDLGTLIGEPSQGAVAEEDLENAEAGAGTGGDKRVKDAPVGDGGFVPALLTWGPVILNEIQKLGGGRRLCAIKVVNKTQRAIRRGNATHGPGASFKKPPPDSIAPGDEDEFLATSPAPLPVLNFPPKGCVGKMDWFLDLGLSWTIEWDNPVSGTVTSATSLTDTGAASRFSVDKINTNEHTAEFRFTIFEMGGNGPNPKPPPKPTPATDLQASCLIEVDNQTEFPLTRLDADHELGDFMQPPEATVPAKSTAKFVSVETAGGKDNGCKGFVLYQIESPQPVKWKIEWNNPEGERNTSLGTLDPADSTFRSQDVIGQADENVPVSFTLSGGGGGDGPVEPPADFKPPVESKQPTLRKGDKSDDGWVEYAQLLLNHKIKAGLPEDGNFDGTMKAAVEKFQTLKKKEEPGFVVDGIIGNQTWAALREGAPEKPGTDGRKPHEFVEKGSEARWLLESEFNNEYDKGPDLLRLAVQTVGDTPIEDGREATIHVTAPGKKTLQTTARIGPAKKNKAGFTHEVNIEKFRKKFPSDPISAPVTGYVVKAFLPQDLGGDHYEGKVREK